MAFASALGGTAFSKLGLSAPLYPACKRSSVPTHSVPCMRSKRERRARPASELPPVQNAHIKAAAAPRVDLESSTLSLRQQLKLARAAAEKTDSAKVRTRFRRKKGDFTATSGKQRRRGEDADVPDGKYSVDQDPIIYIDAYNVIGAWPRLRKHRDRNDMETARHLLLRDVAEYSHVRGWECIVVFDAHGNGQSSILTTSPMRFQAEDARKTDVTPQNVGVIYTGTETADSFIERQVYEWCESGRRQVWAATSDVAQLRFSLAKGAHIMTSTLFIQEIKRVWRETRERSAERDEGAARGKMLMSSVSEETRSQLYELRDRLNR